jgi:TatD DNase family protein
MWIDLHAHLYDKSDTELASCIANAGNAGVSIVVNTPTSIETTGTVLEQLRDKPSWYGTVGISPFDVETVSDGWQEQVVSYLKHDKIIGIGEIGLDNSNPRYPSLEKQLPVFVQLLEIARSKNLPVVMHSRGAEKQVFTLCRELSITRAVFHCYTGGKKTLRQLLDAGYYVSYSGIIETDTPYLAPEPYRGKQNEPAYVRVIGEKVALLKKMPPEEIALQIQRNFSRLFNIPISDT